MARYDTGAVFDTGVIYDATLGVLTADEAVVAGESSALSDRRVVWRDASPAIWTFDPVAWLPVDLLPSVGIDATRSATLSATGRQTETLAFGSHDPTGINFGEGEWLCVQWSATVAYADGTQDSTSFLGGVFRVTGPPGSTEDDAGIVPYRVAAIDWLSYLAQFILSTSGWVLWSDLAAHYTDYLTAGNPSVNAELLVPDYLASLLWFWGSSGDFSFGEQAPFHAVGWTSAGLFRVPDTSLIAAQVTSPGTDCHISNVLDWFWPLVGGYTLAYHADGGLLLSGRTPTDSGLYVTVDTTPIGSVPLPAEAATLSLRQPPYIAVNYTLAVTPFTGPGFLLGGPPQPVSITSPYAQFWSRFGLRIERIIDTDIPVTIAGFESMMAWCVWRLQGYLGAAQTLELTIDSMFPPPPLGRLIAVQLRPADTGPSWPYAPAWYRLVGFTQPLHTGHATWQLQWWSEYP